MHEEKPVRSPKTFLLEERRIRIALIGLIALKVTVLAIFALRSRLVMDEFLQLGYAKYLGHQLFDTLWPPKAVGFALFYKLAHLSGWDATSIILMARLQTALLACATLALTYAIARALGNDRLRALFVLVVLLCFSNFIERSFRTIAEPLALFFAVASLLVVVRGDPNRRHALFAAGLLTGLAFLTTQKSLYFNLALGLGLVGDAMLARQYKQAANRGVWLVLGWIAAVAAYCFMFGGASPLPVLNNIVFGPVEVATRGGDAYGGTIRNYVTQTLTLNAGLYALCLFGIAFELGRIRTLGSGRRIALIFTVVISALVFAHNQPWPYVFIMALPFMALWAPVLFDRLAGNTNALRLAAALVAIAMVASFVRNATIFHVDNRNQLQLVARAEKLVGAQDVYFDGIGMLPNRQEPSTLWLDRTYVLRTLAEGQDSEVHRIFTTNPPKLIIWSYRLDAIKDVIEPLVRSSYVQVAPNIRIAGTRLMAGHPVDFIAPVPGRYEVYDLNGKRSDAQLEVDGIASGAVVDLARGPAKISLLAGPPEALLLPRGSYSGQIRPGRDDPELFAGVYR